jgi:hypothetical protein
MTTTDRIDVGGGFWLTIEQDTEGQTYITFGDERDMFGVDLIEGGPREAAIMASCDVLERTHEKLLALLAGTGAEAVH